VRSERILIVDDEPGVRSALEAILADEGYVVASVGSGEDGLEALQRTRFDAVLLDVWLPGLDGLETLDRIRARAVDVAVIMISGHGTIDTAVRATRLGAFDFIEKPLSLERTLLVVRNALRQRKLERRNQALLEQLARDTEILGSSPVARRLREAAEAAAASDAPVLLCGELGTGRANLARRIHGAGRRAQQPFIMVPCGAFDPISVRQAIFGTDDQPGRLTMAGAGTLFLEGAERLAADVQDRIAAAMSEAASGDDGVRLMASAPPEGAGLRPALLGRLDVIRIDVPPLREHREDVPILAAHFMRDLAREYGRQDKRFAADAVAALTAHAWPGNVRELRNVVERLLVLAPRDTVGVDDLPAGLRGPSPPVDDLYREFPSLAEGLEIFERYHLRRVWTDSGGDLMRAATRLGVEPDWLLASLRRHGIA